jgi:hypothetical protein
LYLITLNATHNTYTHTHSLTLAHTYIHARTHSHTYTNTHAHTHTRTDTRALTHTLTRAHTHTHTHTDTLGWSPSGQVIVLPQPNQHSQGLQPCTLSDHARQHSQGLQPCTLSDHARKTFCSTHFKQSSHSRFCFSTCLPCCISKTCADVV